MNDAPTDEANLEKSSRGVRAFGGAKGINLLTKVASTVKFVVRANNQGQQHNPDPVNRKQLLRKQSTQNVMRVAYIGTNGQLNNKALLVTKERLERPINIDNEEDRKVIINIMVRRTHKRHDFEVQFLQKAFRDVGFFQKMESELDTNSFKKLFAAMQLEVCEPGQKLFNIGDIGTKFYIIIQGSVYILLRKEGIVVDQYTKLTETQAAEVEKKRILLSKELKLNPDEDVKKAKVEECYPGMKILKPLVEGEAFGELALQSTSDRRRTATIVCREKTLLGVLTFEEFRTILGAFYEKKYQEKVNFFQRMDIFHHWRGSQLACLILHMDEMKLGRNHVVFKEGDRSNRLYFIKKGEIELKRDIRIPVSQEEEEERMLDERRVGKRKIKLYKKPEAMRLAILTEGDYFGESELIANKPRSYTAVASSTEVILISISRASFMAYVTDLQSMESLKEHIKKKNEWREELTEKFVQVQVNRKAERAGYHMPKKSSQSLSNIDFTTPRSTKNLDSHNSAPRQFTIQSFAKSPPRELYQSTGFSKTVNRSGRVHNRALSLSKLEQDSQVLRDSSLSQDQPKILPFVSLKKGSGKFESAYQKHKRRLAKRQEQDKGRQQQENETGDDELTGEYEFGKSQSHRVVQATSLNSLTNLNQSGKNEKDHLPTSQSKILYSLLGTKNPSSKNKFEFSLSNLDNSSSYLDPQLTVKAYSTNTLDPTTKIKLSSSININQPDKPVVPIRLSHNDSIRKSQPCSLNELEVTGSSMPTSQTDLDEKQSSTVRFHNKLKKILQIKDNPDSTRASTSRSRLLDPKAYSSLNDLRLAVSSKQLTSSPYNLREGVNLQSQRKGF